MNANSLPEPIVVSTVRIGNFWIAYKGDDSLWISVAEGPNAGEGMQVSGDRKRELEKLVEDFYARVF